MVLDFLTHYLVNAKNFKVGISYQVCKTLLKFNPEQTDKNTHAVFHKYCLNLYYHKKINLYKVGNL